MSFILYQYYHAHVKPLLWEQLVDFGVDISTGQVNRIITDKEVFHQSSESASRSHATSTWTTPERHKEATVPTSNELFAFFESTGSKSRINFLEILRADQSDYVLNDAALRIQKLLEAGDPSASRTRKRGRPC